MPKEGLYGSIRPATFKRLAAWELRCHSWAISPRRLSLAVSRKMLSGGSSAMSRRWAIPRLW